MKIIFVNYLIICLLTSYSLSAQLTNIPVDSVPKTVLTLSKTFAFDYLNTAKPKDLTKFITDHGNLHLLKHYNFQHHKEALNLLKKDWGNLLKITLEEILKSNNGSITLRFKGYFDKIDDVSEIRITTNSLHKFSDITFIQWYYQPFVELYNKPKFEILEIKRVDPKLIERANDIAERTFRCNSSNFLKLTPENSGNRLRERYSKEQLIIACEKRYEQYGSLVNIDLNEIVTDGYRMIYRYQAKYDFVEELLEIIIITHPNHKLLAAELIGVWREKYADPKIEESK